MYAMFVAGSAESEDSRSQYRLPLVAKGLLGGGLRTVSSLVLQLLRVKREKKKIERGMGKYVYVDIDV